MSRFFVTGTGTDVGKTYVACCLARTLVARGVDVGVLKPVVTGVDLKKKKSWAASDPARLLTAIGVTPTIEAIKAIAPFIYEAPISADMAAMKEGRPIDLHSIVGLAQRTAAERAVTILEGVGGLMSPLGSTVTNLDLINALGWPVVLVAGTYLGSISHTLTAVRALGPLRLAAVVLDQSEEEPVDPSETGATLGHFVPVPILIHKRGATELSLPDISPV